MSLILLIDDDQPLRRALRIFLEKSGHTVTEADDGLEGLKLFKAQPADLVITDLMMPEMDGLEMILALRKESSVVPIVAVSGGWRGDTDNYLRMARRFGAIKVFDKPFEFHVLAAEIETLLGGRGDNVPSPSAP
jgi:DNA-binding response OmpR family regulator